MERCSICRKLCYGKLCWNHSRKYIWDSSIKGFRHKKRNTGSRYTKDKYHKHEIELTKYIEDFYGKSVVVTGFHPDWAVSTRGALLEFDILIKPNVLIEYNGRQHYEYVEFFHKEYATFLEQKKRDEEKAILASRNGYELIIFSYTEPMVKDYIISKIERL